MTYYPLSRHITHCVVLIQLRTSNNCIHIGLSVDVIGQRTGTAPKIGFWILACHVNFNMTLGVNSKKVQCHAASFSVDFEIKGF